MSELPNRALLVALDGQARLVPVRLRLVWLVAEWIVIGWLCGFVTLSDLVGMFEKLDKEAKKEDGLTDLHQPSRN